MNKNEEMKILSAFEHIIKLEIMLEQNIISSIDLDKLEVETVKYLKDSVSKLGRKNVVHDILRVAIYNFYDRNAVLAWYIYSSGMLYKNNRKTVLDLVYKELKGTPYLDFLDSIDYEDSMFDDYKNIGYTSEECKTIFSLRLASYYKNNFSLLLNSTVELWNTIRDYGLFDIGNTINYIDVILGHYKTIKTLPLDDTLSCFNLSCDIPNIRNTISTYNHKIECLKLQIKELL